MKGVKALLVGLAILLMGANLTASGPVGVYALVDKVVLENDGQSPDRIQIWGTFAFVDGGIQSASRAAAPVRGYLYFMVPPTASDSLAKTIRAEWADLKAIAGTGQAIAFGDWRYSGAFNVTGDNRMFVTGPLAPSGVQFHVLETLPASPVPYVTNTGIVKLAPQGSHAAIVKQLKDSSKVN